MRALLAAFLLLAPCAALAQANEREVKAAYLFNFLSFVEWPAQALDAGAPIVIGVAGADDVAAELEQMVSGRSVLGRPVTMRLLPEAESVAGMHIVFLGKGQAARLREVVRAAPSQPLLIVCDWDGALEGGAVVNFVRADERVRFAVALEAAAQRGLRISPRMLALAHSVRPAGP
jgi:hypothetical protein